MFVSVKINGRLKTPMDLIIILPQTLKMAKLLAKQGIML